MMSYKRRTVRCSAKGLSQEEALEKLYDHPQFKEGTKVVGIEKQRGSWVAKLLEPKIAAPPPPFVPKEEDDEGETETPKDEQSDEDSEDDAPEEGPKDDGGPSEIKEPESESKGLEATVKELSTLVHAIAEKLGVTPEGPEDELLGDEPPIPPELGGGPPDGPPGGEGPPPPKGSPAKKPPSKLRPGETPPGVTPINTPAFASNGNGEVLGRVASFTACEVTDMPIAQAKQKLESKYGEYGYEVKQIKAAKTKDGHRELRALLSVR